MEMESWSLVLVDDPACRAYEAPPLTSEAEHGSG